MELVTYNTCLSIFYIERSFEKQNIRSQKRLLRKGVDTLPSGLVGSCRRMEGISENDWRLALTRIAYWKGKEKSTVERVLGLVGISEAVERLVEERSNAERKNARGCGVAT